MRERALAPAPAGGKVMHYESAYFRIPTLIVTPYDAMEGLAQSHAARQVRLDYADHTGQQNQRDDSRDRLCRADPTNSTHAAKRDRSNQDDRKQHC